MTEQNITLEQIEERIRLIFNNEIARQPFSHQAQENKAIGTDVLQTEPVSPTQLLLQMEEMLLKSNTQLLEVQRQLQVTQVQLLETQKRSLEQQVQMRREAILHYNLTNVAEPHLNKGNRMPARRIQIMPNMYGVAPTALKPPIAYPGDS